MNRKGKRLAILTNIPENWKDLSFENLTTPDGLKVSIKMQNGKITKCEIINMNDEKREICLILPNSKEINFALNNLEVYKLKR